jgi:Tle cognate immunity protein 4 C-terminal domain/Tle cognate immunity protein 4 N-terminal domain
MTEKMKTVCVGRFLIDLPEGAKFSRSQTFIDGFQVSAVAESAEAFSARVAARQAEIEAQPNELRRKNLESVAKVDVNGFAGQIFIFGRNSTYTMEFGKRHVWENVVLEGYVHANGLSFDLISDGYDPRLVGNLPRLIKQLRLVEPGHVPDAPGFCFGAGMFLDPLTADQGEGTTIFVSLPGHPDVAMAFSTMAGMKPGPGLLERNTRAASREPFWMRAAFKTLREGRRSINGLPGEELAVKVTELNFSIVYGLDWEMAGKENDVMTPFLHLELETGRNPNAGGKPVQSSLAQKAVLELWDKVSSTIRLRRAAPAGMPAQGPSGPPLGAFASAGEVCPHTGWWQCNEGGNGVSVLGGQRQYLRQGQRMPQALLLQPQSLWERARGIQRSFEAQAPTAWKLVDKRAGGRGESALLAPATAVPQADGSGEAFLAPDPGVQPGACAKTGEPCPASGWWRCGEPQALDGTRWFAQGSLFPPATFKVPPGTFGRSSGAPGVIQRRSSWKLVRLAPSGAHDKPPAPTGAGQAQPDDPPGA